MKQFINSMENNLFSPVYLIFGDEPLLIEEAIALLKEKAVGADDWNMEVFDGSECTVGQVVAAASTMPFFGQRRLVVVKNIPWLGKAGKKKDEKDENPEEAANEDKQDLGLLLDYINSPNQSTILALTLSGTAERRRKLVKAIEKTGRLVACHSYKGEELLHWMADRAKERGYRFSRPAMELLTLACGNNMAYLSREIDKACSYCGEKKEVSLEDAEAVVSRAGLINIFELMDKVAAKNGAESIRLFQTMTREGEPEQKILSMLGKQFRDMLGVLELSAQGLKAREIAGLLDIHPFVAEKYLKSSKAFKASELIRFMELLLNADIANKTGEGDLHNLLELTILRICGSQG